MARGDGSKEPNYNCDDATAWGIESDFIGRKLPTPAEIDAALVPFSERQQREGDKPRDEQLQK